ncbi:MAG TPA: DUF2889 domain-containing protein [Burkholderiaceae bacterium]|nr:DUF2889 domain-containing protein [Burkholderiaceae bacterium]
MAQPAPDPQRQLKHRRHIDVAVYARSDGLWEVEARLTDTKTRDVVLAGDVRRAGDPVHDMTLHLVVDTRFNILAAAARTDGMPYPGQCNAYGDAYGRLVGLNLLKGFRQAVKERLGGVQGCTHITEMTQVLPTAVIQAFAGEVLDTQEGAAGPSDQPPFQIDRCHALRSDGQVVRQFYPRWYRPQEAEPASP